MPTYVQLPANLVAENNVKWKTMYWTDYCEKAKRKLLPRRSAHKSALKNSGNAALNRTFMKDHFPEYGHLHLKNDYEDLLVARGKQLNLSGRTNGEIRSPTPDKQMASTRSEKPLKDTLPGTMKALEKAWMSEVQTNKRERGNIYGAAGKKTDLSRPKTAPNSAGDAVPGLDNWLQTANEHEKQVVYTFLDSVSRSMTDEKAPSPLNVDSTEKGTLQNTKKVRVSSAPAYVQRYSPAPSSRGSQRSNISSNSSNSVHRLNLDLPKNTDTIKRVKTAVPVRSPPSPKHVGSTDEKSLRRAKSAVSIRELENEELPQAPLSARSNGTTATQQSCVHKNCYGHNETKCARCRDKLIKSLIKELEREDIEPPDEHFPGLRLPAHNRFYNTSAYYATEPDDYVHQHSLFTNAPKGNRGYFIIHPDWVSEFQHHRPSYR